MINPVILLIGPLGTNFSEILFEIHIFSSRKIHLKMLSAKWCPFCPRLDVLRDILVYYSMFTGYWIKASRCIIIMFYKKWQLVLRNISYKNTNNANNKSVAFRGQAKQAGPPTQWGWDKTSLISQAMYQKTHFMNEYCCIYIQILLKFAISQHRFM